MLTADWVCSSIGDWVRGGLRRKGAIDEETG